MTSVKPLLSEWLWGSEGASNAFRDLIRTGTPETFLAKSILTRDHDWITL